MNQHFFLFLDRNGKFISFSCSNLYWHSHTHARKVKHYFLHTLTHTLFLYHVHTHFLTHTHSFKQSPTGTHTVALTWARSFKGSSEKLALTLVCNHSSWSSSSPKEKKSTWLKVMVCLCQTHSPSNFLFPPSLSLSLSCSLTISLSLLLSRMLSHKRARIHQTRIQANMYHNMQLPPKYTKENSQNVVTQDLIL